MDKENNKHLVFGIISLLVLFFAMAIFIFNIGYKTSASKASDFNKFYADLLTKHKHSYEVDRLFIDAAPEKYADFFYKYAEGIKVIINNKTLEFVSEKGLEEKNYTRVKFYSYMLFIPEINSHLIREDWYEGNQYILINNETGATQDIWNIPHISPQKNRLAIVNKDMIAGYTANGIQIFEIVSGNYIKQFERQLEWGAADPRWQNNDTLSVDKYVFNIKNEKYPEKLIGQTAVKRVAEEWIILD
ncbi:hypothetical protein NO1_1859 [Candidatus Termititenax aidoneus]|uniref:Uncharacterized protein n=1 Tax=Termititenax aidoneus TaxID=2218524 RepID=A0A388TCZ6_TERA1|nr:hypothetical protein NO1_1859 [Candidatus Termititenax aidoneus]